MEGNNERRADFTEQTQKLREYLFVLGDLEEKLYGLLETHPEEILLHAALALVTVSLEVLSQLMELLALWK